jgi:hypothetical protein
MNSIEIKKAADSKMVSRVTLKELVDAGVFEGNPVTARQVAGMLGGDMETASLALEQQSESGRLARFKVGSIEYYGAPVVVLAGKGPSLIRIMIDGVREWVCSLKLVYAKKTGSLAR